MERLCDNCVHCYKPTSIKDYFDKTLTMPDIHKWGIDVFKHQFWLCSSESIAHKDHSDGSLIMKPCYKNNFHGYCDFFKTSNSEDIKPSSISIEPPKEEIRQGDKVSLSVIITPCTIPAVIKEVPVTVEVELRDENGGLILDEKGSPKYITEEHLESVIVIPEHENDQNITYLYQWYKNNRKLYKENNNSILIDTSAGTTDVYKCEVKQFINENGDGGIKSAAIFTNEVTLDVIKVNKIILTLKAGTDPTSIPLPIIPSEIKTPKILTNGWTIADVEATNDCCLVKETENVSIECSEGLHAVLNEKLEIYGKSGILKLKWDNV